MSSPPRRFGVYSLLEELARGGQGVVWRARHEPSGQLVALKLLLDTAREQVKRFHQEARVLARLEHPHLLRHIEHGEVEGRAFLALELIEGEDLANIVRHRGVPDPQWSARMLIPVARALAYCHAQGIVHRDLKPANVLVERASQRPVLVDLGLVKRDAERMRLSSIDAGSRFSQAGGLKGTPEYMAPEQVNVRDFGEVSPASDVYALGATLYHLLTGEPPFRGHSVVAIVRKVTRKAPESPLRLNPRAPRGMVELCLRCLAKRPEERPPSAEAFARELAAAAGIELAEETDAGGDTGKPRGRSRPRRPPVRVGRAWLPLGVGLLLLLSLGATWGLWLESEPPPEAAEGPAVTPSPTASPTSAPWAKPPPGWQVVWSLAEGPELVDPALWADAAGRLPDPLGPARAAAAGDPVKGFLGEARSVGPGRVRVTYRDLARALRIEPVSPGDLFILGGGPSGQVLPQEEGGARILADNDLGQLLVWVGRARWSEAAVSLRVRRVEPIDMDEVQVILGDAAEGAQAAGLRLDHRRGEALVNGSPARVPFQLDAGWTELRWAPGLAPGRRVRLGDTEVADLDAAADALPGAGRLRLTLAEVHVELADLSVEGRPLRGDRSAWAVCRPQLPALASVSLAFSERGPAAGGPLVALGSVPWDEALILELDGPRALLRQGSRLLDVADLGPAPAGWLRLEREGEVLRGIVAAGERRVTLTGCSPLPLPGDPLQAAYGSSAPRLRVERVEVARGAADASDPLRAGFDAAAASGSQLALQFLEESPDPKSRWRRGALLLAQVSDFALGDPELRGDAARAARRIRAAEAARLLAQAANALAEPASRDAQARALLAWICAAEAAEAESCARALVAAEGLARARERVDALWRLHERPALLARLEQGYVSIYDSAVREASLRAAQVLSPERRAHILVQLASTLRNRRPRPDPRSPAGRRVLESALALYAEGQAAGYADADAIAGLEADTLMDLGRLPEALTRWDQVVQRSRAWWPWFRRAICQAQLGRVPAALESALGALVGARTRGGVRNLIVQLAQQISGDRPGLVASALHALFAAGAGAELRDPALELARRARTHPRPREADLGAYVLAALGEGAGSPPELDRATAVLAAARAGEPRACEALPEAARAESLVRHLAELDPELASLLR